MLFNFYKNKVKLSYGITVCNEYEELARLLDALLPLINKNDEVLVLQDVTNPDERVTAQLARYTGKIVHIQGKLNGDFATFKNTLIEKATGDFLFQIDADEVPKKSLIRRIKRVIVKNADADCFLVPRINIVEGITAEDIARWQWNVDKNNRANFPDYQFRIFKLNGLIRWKNKLHEELYGYRKNVYLSHKTEKYCLVHYKTIAKQRQQDEFYSTIK